MFQFMPEYDGTLSMESAVYQAIGAASACWDKVTLASIGEFHSEEAKQIGQVLLDFIQASFINYIHEMIQEIDGKVEKDDLG